MPLPTSRASSAAEQLRAHIQRNLSEGDQLPPESDLAAAIGVSRMTLRQALQQLWLEGRISRRWGVGTFVRRAHDTAGRTVQTLVDASPIGPLPRRLRDKGHDVSLRRFGLDQIQPTEELAASMGSDDVCWRLARVLVIDGVPGVHMLEHLPLTLNGRPIDPLPLFDIESSLTELARQSGAPLERMEGPLTATVADSVLAERLETPVGTPLLRLTQTSTTKDDAVVCWSELTYRPDVMEWRLVRSLAP